MKVCYMQNPHLRELSFPMGTQEGRREMGEYPRLTPSCVCVSVYAQREECSLMLALPPALLGTVSLMSLPMCKQTGWPESAQVLWKSLRLTRHSCRAPGFYIDHGDSNLGHHTCVANVFTLRHLSR